MEKTRKHSRQREAILACLQSTASHPTAEWVYQQLKPQLPALSLGTVYRNLALFRKEGVICSVGTVDGLERFDADTSPHAHFVCRRCHAVTDVHTPLPDGLCQSVERELGARECRCSLTFTGLCARCRNSSVSNLTGNSAEFQ